jgi:hypothetical protein
MDYRAVKNSRAERVVIIISMGMAIFLYVFPSEKDCFWKYLKRGTEMMAKSKG